ncbi:hypothetical protein [Paraburkholderia sp. GAS41]
MRITAEHQRLIITPL